MSTDKFHTYRGDVRAVAAVGNTLAFVTVHPEGQPTAVYRLHGEKYTLTNDPLPAGGVALLAAADGLWVGGSDGRVYQVPTTGGTPVARGPQLAAPPVALAPLAGERLAVATGNAVTVLSRSDGSTSQTLELTDPVTALASDPTGQWLAVGTAKGTVAVFECESDPSEFRQSDAAPLHEAPVTALLFEADELRFLSAGADQKLLSTHARGRLEAEDRGRGANHEQPITGVVAITADRFLSGSQDASLKSWPRAKGARPVTLKDGVAKVVAVAVAVVHDRPNAVAACDDNTLHFFPLDEEGKFADEEATKVHGVEDWAKNEFGHSDAKRREAALRKLAEFADTTSLDRIAEQMKNDHDHGLRLLACQLLGASAHPREAKLLEKGLNHRDQAVREAAFAGMRRHAGPNDLWPMALALKTDKADIGQLAVQALEGLAAKDDQALARLVEALDAQAPEVRRAALTALEKVHPSRSPEASLTALGSKHADLRRLALVRLHQRELLHDPRVQAALRWRGEDGDAEVRRVAFLLSLYTREKLLRALRERDPELNRQLTELESGTLPAIQEQPAANAPAPPNPSPAQPAGPGALADLNVLTARVEEMARQGLLPPQFVEQVRQQLTAGRGAELQAVLGTILTQAEALARRQARKPEEGS
jgi:ParB family chromosome partitioning protein